MLTTVICLLLAPASQAKPRHGHSRGYLAAVALNRKLAGTPMHGTGWGLVDEARPYGLNPALIAAIAGTESSYGAAACWGNRKNAYGLSSCGRGWRVPVFRSWRESYRFMARFLASRWPRARSPYDFHGYARCSACWGRKTAEHMRALGFPETVLW